MLIVLHLAAFHDQFSKSASVSSLSAGVLREVTTHFTVDARAHYKSGGSHIKACISNPSGVNTDAYITDKGDGTYRVEYTPYEDGETSSVLVH